MRSVERIMRLANRFERSLRKYAAAKTVSSLFFFDDNINEKKKIEDFNKKINDQIGKLLIDNSTKTSKSSSFKFSFKIDDSFKASYNLEVNPPALKSAIKKKLDEIYKEMTGRNLDTGISEIQKILNASEEKESGEIEFETLNVDM